MAANPRPGRWMFWVLLPVIAAFVVVMALPGARDPTWTPTAVLVATGLGAALLMLLLVLWDDDRFWWAGRLLAGLVAVGFAAYAATEAQGLIGLILIGGPAFWYACTGRFSLRPTRFDRWSATWDAREAALTDLFGPPEPEVFHSEPPLDRGGYADVLAFRGYVPGVTYVTADFTGAFDDAASSQVPNSSGNYELMLCARAPTSWAAPALAELARYTLHTVVEPGHTMHVGPIAGSNLEHLAFATPDLGEKRFEFLGRSYGLLLAVGITSAELRFAQAEGTPALLTRLREAGIFPYTEPGRPSIV